MSQPIGAGGEQIKRGVIQNYGAIKFTSKQQTDFAYLANKIMSQGGASLVEKIKIPIYSYLTSNKGEIQNLRKFLNNTVKEKYGELSKTDAVNNQAKHDKIADQISKLRIALIYVDNGYLEDFKTEKFKPSKEKADDRKPDRKSSANEQATTDGSVPRPTEQPKPTPPAGIADNTAEIETPPPAIPAAPATAENAEAEGPPAHEAPAPPPAAKEAAEGDKKGPVEARTEKPREPEVAMVQPGKNIKLMCADATANLKKQNTELKRVLGDEFKDVFGNVREFKNARKYLTTYINNTCHSTLVEAEKLLTQIKDNTAFTAEATNLGIQINEMKRLLAEASQRTEIKTSYMDQLIEAAPDKMKAVLQQIKKSPAGIKNFNTSNKHTIIEAEKVPMTNEEKAKYQQGASTGSFTPVEGGLTYQQKGEPVNYYKNITIHISMDNGNIKYEETAQYKIDYKTESGVAGGRTGTEVTVYQIDEKTNTYSASVK